MNPSSMRSELPTGTVTFLFTDIEGSTRLLHALGPDAYTEALAEHRRLLRASVLHRRWEIGSSCCGGWSASAS
jgi:class 3 adenylate cyclase